MNRFSFLAGTFATACAVLSAAACSSSSDNADGSSSGSTDGGGADRARLPEPYRPAASCPVVIETPALLEASHVPETDKPVYNSNPPSSGPHYPVWANFQEFDAPVPDGYLVHSLEHGGVLLLYKCAAPGAACDAIKAGLRKVRDAVPTDPKCDSTTRVRVVIAPDPRLEVPVAAAAWGWTYKGDCLDVPTLTDFAKAHYNQGTEDLCVPGQATFPE